MKSQGGLPRKDFRNEEAGKKKSCNLREAGGESERARERESKLTLPPSSKREDRETRDSLSVALSRAPFLLFVSLFSGVSPTEVSRGVIDKEDRDDRAAGSTQEKREKRVVCLFEEAIPHRLLHSPERELPAPAPPALPVSF